LAFDDCVTFELNTTLLRARLQRVVGGEAQVYEGGRPMVKLNMRTRAATIWGAVGAVWLLAATAVHAQPIATVRLVQPSDLFQVTSSPSGSRIAGLVNVGTAIGGRQVVPLVARWRGDRLRSATTYHLGEFQSVARYRWLNDDHLLLEVEDLRSGWITPVVAGISEDTYHIWRPLWPFTQLLEYPWGDKDHALLQQDSADKDGDDYCHINRQAFCLISLNVNHWGGERISDPLSMLPVQFLAASPFEIYASGRENVGPNVLGPHQEFRLEPDRRWQRVPDGTFAQRLASLKKAQQPPASLMALADQVGIHHPTFIMTAHSHRVVGVVGRAPEPAFVALDPRLEVVQSWLATHYPTARVSLSGLNESLTAGVLTVWDADLPPTEFILGPDGELTRFEQASPRIQADRLGRTHLEPRWAPGEAVAVTVPPAGVALRGVVVTPVLASASVLQDPLHDYDAQVQAFAQQGIAVVQLLAPIPDAFASDAEGAAWRAAFDQRLQEVVDHAGRALLHGEPVCLYGERLAGELALAAGVSHVGCVAAVNAILNASQLSRVRSTGLPLGFGSAMVRLVGPTEQMLHREFPVVFGNQGGGLNESVSWVPGLPRSVMLGYDAIRFADATRGFTVGNFADGSAAFRAAAHKAGKQIEFYRPDTLYLISLRRDARMIDAVTRYVHDYYAAGVASSAEE
jgi:hypothetical protein